MSDKVYITPARLTRDAFQLARMILDSGFRPHVLLVLWRGGTPVGVIVHEFLEYHGIQTYHTAVKATSYSGIGVRSSHLEIEGIEPVLARIESGQKVLLIDDIFDTGFTVKRMCELLAARTLDVRVATLYYKPGNNQTDRVPDFFLSRVDSWIVFPHELVGLTPDEIREKDPAIFSLCNPDSIRPD